MLEPNARRGADRHGQERLAKLLGTVGRQQPLDPNIEAPPCGLLSIDPIAMKERVRENYSVAIRNIEPDEFRLDLLEELFGGEIGNRLEISQDGLASAPRQQIHR